MIHTLFGVPLANYLIVLKQINAILIIKKNQVITGKKFTRLYLTTQKHVIYANKDISHKNQSEIDQRHNLNFYYK